MKTYTNLTDLLADLQMIKSGYIGEIEIENYTYKVWKTGEDSLKLTVPKNMTHLCYTIEYNRDQNTVDYNYDDGEDSDQRGSCFMEGGNINAYAFRLESLISKATRNHNVNYG